MPKAMPLATSTPAPTLTGVLVYQGRTPVAVAGGIAGSVADCVEGTGPDELGVVAVAVVPAPTGALGTLGEDGTGGDGAGVEDVGGVPGIWIGVDGTVGSTGVDVGVGVGGAGGGASV